MRVIQSVLYTNANIITLEVGMRRGAPLPAPVLVLASSASPPSPPTSHPRPTRDATIDLHQQMPLETRVTAISKIDATATRRGRELRTIRISRTWILGYFQLKRQSVSQSVTDHRDYYVSHLPDNLLKPVKSQACLNQVWQPIP